MLTRTATRRSAAVLMVALVAMLLVATGGSARASQARLSVGTGHASAAPQAGRHTVALAPAPADHVQLHLDLASTPPADVAARPALVGEPALAGPASLIAHDVVTPVGRAPPAA